MSSLTVKFGVEVILDLPTCQEENEAEDARLDLEDAARILFGDNAKVTLIDMRMTE